MHEVKRRHETANGETGPPFLQLRRVAKIFCLGGGALTNKKTSKKQHNHSRQAQEGLKGHVSRMGGRETRVRL